MGKKLIKLLLGVLIIAGSILYILPFFWNMEGYRSQITSSIKNATGQATIIRGDITMRFLPLPEVNIADIYLSDPKDETGASVIRIQSIRIHLNMFALLSGKTEMSGITLVQPQASWQNIRAIRNHWNESDKEGEETSEGLVTTAIENGRIFFGDSRKRSTTKLEQVNAEINAASISGPFIVKGDFFVNENKFSFDADISTTEKAGAGDSTWNFMGDGFKVTFIGDLAGQGKEGGTLSGVLRASSDDLDYMIAKYFHQKDVALVQEKDKKKEGEESTSVPFLAEGKLTYSKKLFRIEELAIASDYISGRGSVRLSTASDVPEGEISMVLDSINVDKITGSAYDVSADVSADGDEMTAETFIAQTAGDEDMYERISRVIGGVAQEFNMLLDISIKDITYNNQSVQKLVFNADMFSGDFVINEFTALLPGNSFLEVIGSIKHNAIRPRFSGEVALSGDSLRNFSEWIGFSLKNAPEGTLGKYKLNGDVVLLPQKVNFSSIDLSVDKTRASGSLIVRYGDQSPKIISNLSISHLDLDTYQLSEPLAKLLQNYYQGNPDNPSSKNFNWLRSLKGQFSGELMMDDLTFYSVKFKNLSSLFFIVPGKLRIEKLDIGSQPLTLSSSLNFDITSIRPKIDFALDAKNINTNAFKLFHNPEAKVEEKAEENIPGVIAETTAPETKVAERWPSNPLYFFGLDRFDGKIRVNAGTFQYKKINLENISMETRLYEGTLGFDNFSADYNTGKLAVRGIINIEETPNVAISFALNNIQIEKFLEIFSDITSISGYTSMSGSIVTFGNSYLDWLKNAKASIGLVGRAVKFSNFGLHDLIERSEDVTIARQLTDIALVAAKQGETPIETLESQMQLAGGMLDFSGMKITTSRVSGVMNGRVDVVNWLMNVVGRFAYITVDDHATVNLVFNAVGAVSNPEKTFDLTDLFRHKGIAVTPKQ